MGTTKNAINENNVVEKTDKKTSKKIKEKFFVIFIGGIIGFLNGFFGGGGGMICVPALERVLKLPPKKAHATAIAVIFPLSLISSIIYVANGAISSLPLLTIGVGVVLGGILGSFLLKVLPSKLIGIIFSILMIVAGVRLIL